jgi:hypothetical protein
MSSDVHWQCIQVKFLDFSGLNVFCAGHIVNVAILIMCGEPSLRFATSDSKRLLGGAT